MFIGLGLLNSKPSFPIGVASLCTSNIELRRGFCKVVAAGGAAGAFLPGWFLGGSCFKAMAEAASVRRRGRVNFIVGVGMLLGRT
jgi:hypothetical protein